MSIATTHPLSTAGPYVGSEPAVRSARSTFRDTDRAAALASAARCAVLAVAGALPVLSITAHAFGVMHMAVAARFVDLPVVLVAVALMLRRSTEGVWAARGVVAGLIAVAAYDMLRMPLVVTHIWPDFFERVGSWVIHGNSTQNLVVGYVWRYVGDGGGIAIAFFLGAAAFRLRRHVLAWAVGYGVFVWAGLMATVALPADGQRLLFHLTPAAVGLSLAGHLVYGATLGACYRYAIARFGLPEEICGPRSGPRTEWSGPTTRSTPAARPAPTASRTLESKGRQS
jgi:hypothetical protein